MFDDWDERYQYVIDLGKSLPLIDEKYKDDDHIVKGCQSKVWLHADQKDGRVVFTADMQNVLPSQVVPLCAVGLPSLMNTTAFT